MLIGRASKLTGFSKDTIRFYERIGLLPLSKNNRGPGNYRYYGRDEIEKLFQIKFLKGFGFTLREIGKLFRLGDSLECDSLSELIDEKVLSIEKEIDRLGSVRDRLNEAKTNCSGRCTDLVDMGV